MKTKTKLSNYSEYTHYISSEASYYGSGCSQADSDRIVSSLGDLILGEFPGINIEQFNESGGGSCKTTGPDESTIETIERWVTDNWTAAL